MRHGVEKISTRATTLVETSLQSDSAFGSYEPSKSWDSNRDNFGTILGLQLGGPGKKSHLNVVPAERCREYYMGGRWWLPPSPGRGESCGPKCPWLVPTPKGVPECELTTLWFVLDADSSLIY